MEQKVYSVSRVNSYIRGMFEEDLILSHIWVQGEVSNVSYHRASGHIYFSIKDSESQLSCIMFSGKRGGLAFLLEEGQKVRVHGSISIYERDGKYQLYADRIRLEGQGELYEKFLQLKAELEEEGLFSPIYKKKLPVLIKRLGVVTAQGGAALQDIINISHRRNPFVQLILYPAQVQGEGAARTVVEGIKRLSVENVDAIIVGRGGGSIEDLWAFNEEIVARAIFDCPVPVISAVGHATDISISDFVADVYAPTPSAAAELAVADIRDVLVSISEYGEKLNNRMKRNLEQKKSLLFLYKSRLSGKSPKAGIRMKQQRLGEIEGKLAGLMKRRLEMKWHELDIYIEKMKALSPLDKLSGGYTYVSDEEGKAVSSIKQLKPGSRVNLRLSDGRAAGVIEETVFEKL